MNLFSFKNYKYILIPIFVYLIFLVIKNLLNIYTFLIIIIILLTFYIRDKRLFKKTAYKLLFKNKKNFSIKNKYVAAKDSLEGINIITKKINNKVNAELLNYEKNNLEKQLRYGDYNVTLFGAGSSGKTSVARALLKSLIGKTSPTLGTTTDITSYKIRIPILKRNINIVDTPGLFEPSREGEEREKSTILEASKSDIVLFVIDQDINKYELYLINELSEIGKKIIIVLNKCDLRSKIENNIIQDNISSIITSKKLDISVVKTIAAPKPIQSTELIKIKTTPEVGNLFKEIIKTLDENGEELLADNILFKCNKLGIISKKIFSEQRLSSANKVINKYTWITGGVILVNPLPVVDFIATTSVNIQMILEIAKIFDRKITKKEASSLSKSLLTTLAKLGILKGGLNLITTTLSSNFTTMFVAKSLQSITSGWLIRVVGLSIIEYFMNGENWGNGGIQEVVERIYNLNKREEILNNFINEAIKKIQIKADYKYQLKLPPHYEGD